MVQEGVKFHFGVKWKILLSGSESVSRTKVLQKIIIRPYPPSLPRLSSHSPVSQFPLFLILSPSIVCQVTKRDEDSSLMQLKEEFRTYEALRREHDAQIVHIAMEAGLRISPEQWSSLLYGDLVHKSHMQSIIDKVPVWFICQLGCHSTCHISFSIHY